MKKVYNIKNYSEFRLNEELTRNQRILLHLPYLLMGSLGRKMGITTMLNYKWDEIKKKTKDSNFDPVLATSGSNVSKMKRNLKKISINDLPENKLGFATFLRKWNLYLVEGDNDKHQDIYPRDKSKSDLYKRPITYISKDEIKTGDTYIGERVSDREIYDQFSKAKKLGKEYPDNLTEFPIVVMIAKVDFAEESKDIEEYINDICIDLEDELPVETKPKVYETGDKVFIDIKINEGYNLEYNKELYIKMEELAKTIKSYLKTIGKFDYKVYYSIKDQITYYGEEGRFKDIRKVLKKYDSYWNRDDESGYVNPVGGINLKFITGERISVSGILSDIKDKRYIKGNRYYLRLEGDDMNVIMNDISNCSTLLIKKYQRIDIEKAKKGDRGPVPSEIKLKKITISFDKKA